MQVQRHLAAELHRSITDASAAIGIARYLLEQVREEARDTTPAAAVTFYRTLRSVMLRRVEVIQQLQALLPQVQPELVQYTRHSVPDWIIELLGLFPTAAALAAATVEQVDAVKTVLPERARTLVAGAATSVASLTGPAAAASIRLLVKQIHELDRTIAAGEQTVRELVEADPLHRRQVQLLLTIPGIGERTAYVLSLELGDVQQFRDDPRLDRLVRLDPHEDRSGDGVVRAEGISHRGNAHVRPGAVHAHHDRHPSPARADGLLRAAVRAWQTQAGRPGGVHAQAPAHRLRHPALGVGLRSRAQEQPAGSRRTRRLSGAQRQTACCIARDRT